MAVSAVLMGTGEGRVRVAPATASRIREVARSLGYRPNQAARQLSGQRSSVIALAAHSPRNFLTQAALSWLHEAAEPAGLRVLAVHGERGLNPLEQLVREVRAGWIDGLVYLAHENDCEWTDAAQLLATLPQGVVAVGDLQTDSVKSVIADVASGARASLQHLCSRGRTRLVFVTEEVETLAIRTRIHALLEPPDKISDGETAELPYLQPSQIIEETRGWYTSDPAFYPKFVALARSLIEVHRADAVLCDTDFTAIGLLRAFRTLGVKVPDDIAVVGWGDLQGSSAYDPALTTVSYQLPRLLERVVAKLQIDDDVESSSIVERLPMQLIVRESS